MTRQLLRRSKPLAPADIERSAIVFAPHPDDETLGCGGLVAAKRSLGVRVQVVFMTDGAASHSLGPERDDLAKRRRVEATTACRILGVDLDDICFLDFPDGDLHGSRDLAVERVTAILEGSPATQMILPHPDEPPLDHSVVCSIVDRALRSLHREAQALLFPVWLWDQWPWTNPLSQPRQRHARRQIIRVALRDRLGLRVLKEFDFRHDLAGQLDKKREAIAAHATQMSRPEGQPEWLTLGDIANGEWLNHLLQPVEYYSIDTIGSASDQS